MRTRTLSLLLVAALSVTVAGCTERREPPPPPDAPDAEVVTQQRIDQVWERSGLEATVERPQVEPSADRSFEALSACISDEGIDDWMMSDGPDGPGLDAMSASNTVDVQLALYVCFARHPTKTLSDGASMSPEQLDYLYDYYGSWLIPCLASQSIAVIQAPSREEFVSGVWTGWTPYSSAPAIDTAEEYEAALAVCGGPFADLDLSGVDISGDSMTISVAG